MTTTIAQRVLATDAPPLSPLMERATRMREAGQDIIVLAQAMVDYAPPRMFMQALTGALRDGVASLHQYAPDPGIPELCRALASYISRSFGLSVDPEEGILVTPGANHAAYMALSTLLEPGDEAMLISPWYFNHEMSVRLLGAKVRSVVAPPETGFVPRIEDLLRAWTPQVKVLILVNPNNPTGARYPDAWIRDLAKALARDPHWRDVWILSDQTYQEIYFSEGPPLSIGSLDVLSEKVITVSSFSKSFALAGWRLGFLVGPARFLAQALKIQDCSIICAPHAAQWALAHALDDCEGSAGYFAEKRELLRRRRDALLAPLREDNRFQLCESQGACFAFLGMPEGVDAEAYAWRLLESGGVVTVPGVHFGREWTRFLRLSFGSGTEERLREAGTRIRDSLSRTNRNT